MDGRAADGSILLSLGQGKRLGADVKDGACGLEICGTDCKNTEVVYISRYQIRDGYRRLSPFGFAHWRLLVLDVLLPRISRSLTFHTVDLDDMLMDRIVKIRLFPGDTDLTGRYLFQGHLGGRRDVQAELVHEDVIGSLADLPRAIQQPEDEAVRSILRLWSASDLPDQGPQDGGRQKESHDASHPHSRDHAGVGVKGQIQRFIHPSVGRPSTGTEDRSQR